MTSTGAASPFRGAAYYNSEDAKTFFGRQDDADAFQLVVLGHLLSLLHGSSGVGKTSLLRASVLLGLENEGYVGVISRPNSNPARQLRRDVLDRVLPPPAAECRAIDRTVEIMGRNTSVDEAALGLDTRLGDIRAWFTTHLKPNHRDHRAFLSPVKREDGSFDLLTDECLPLVIRYFLLEDGPFLLARHLCALERQAQTNLLPAVSVEALERLLATWPLGELRGFFSHKSLQDMHQSRLRHLLAKGLSLVEFFERLQLLWGQDVENFGIVLVLDQFEQLFTLFGEQGQGRDPQPGRSAKDKRDYIAEIGSIVAPSPHRLERLPPLKIVIAMRNEYVTDLDEIRERVTASRFRELIGTARYHLLPLTTQGVEDVLEQAVAPFAVTFAPDLVRWIAGGLADSDRYVLPGHLQIVASWLWNKRGAMLVSAGGGVIGTEALAEGAPDADLSTDKGGQEAVGDVLKGHFGRFLQDQDPIDRAEILDFLKPLILGHGTSAATRTSVSETTLIDAPFRSKERRKRILERLAREHMVRLEQRLEGKHVELTHEFLIDPIIEESKRFLKDQPQLRKKWRTLGTTLERLQLEKLERKFREPGSRLLDRDELAALEAWIELVDLENNPWVAELMYRSALAPGHTVDVDLLRLQRDRLSQHPVVLDGRALLEAIGRREEEDLLDCFELEAVRSEAPGWPPSDRHALGFLLKSAIANAQPNQQPMIKELTRSLSS